MRAGEPLGQALRDGVAHRLVEARLRRRRDEPADDVLGQVDQDAGGLAVAVLHDQAARRVRGAARDAGAGERVAAGPGRVAVHADERDRVPGRRAIERGARREPLPGPARLVPPAPGDPLPRPQPRGGRRDHPGDLVLRAGGGQVQLESRAGEQHQVPVAVHEPGQHRAPAQVERGLARGRVDVAPPAREGHAALADHEGIHDGAGGVHRVNPAVGQQHGDRRAARARGASSGQGRRPPAPRSPAPRS